MLSLLFELKKNKILFLMLAPVFIYFLIFGYFLMPGSYIAFVNYKFSSGIFGSEFVGFDNFKFLYINGDLWRITRNTILYNLVFILLGNAIQVVLAIMLSEVYTKWFKRISQSVMLFPNFISFVIVGIFSYNMFNFSTGSVNAIIDSFGYEKHDFFADPDIWKYIITSFYFWKTVGYGMIIYLAAITGINTDMYEAAYMDGASIFQKIRFITLPSLKATFVMLLLFGLGGILKGQFDLFYNIIGDNSMLFAQTDIIDTYVYRSLLGDLNFSNSAAVGLYQSFFGLILILVVNGIVKKINSDYSLF